MKWLFFFFFYFLPSVSQRRSKSVTPPHSPNSVLARMKAVSVHKDPAEKEKTQKMNLLLHLTIKLSNDLKAENYVKIHFQV